MTPDQALQVLRSLLNTPVVKLVITSADIAMCEQALKVLTPAPDASRPTP